MRPVRLASAVTTPAACGQGLPGGFQGDGEAGPVGVGAGDRFGGGGHGPAQRLVEGQQRPHLLFQAGWVF